MAILRADPFAATRVRLAALELRLAQLRAQYDLLMNRFEFDKARILAPRIEAIEREVDALAKGLPPSPPAPPAPHTVMRRRRRR